MAIKSSFSCTLRRASFTDRVGDWSFHDMKQWSYLLDSGNRGLSLSSSPANGPGKTVLSLAHVSEKGLCPWPYSLDVTDGLMETIFGKSPMPAGVGGNGSQNRLLWGVCCENLLRTPCPLTCTFSLQLLDMVVRYPLRPVEGCVSKHSYDSVSIKEEICSD